MALHFLPPRPVYAPDMATGDTENNLSKIPEVPVGFANFARQTQNSATLFDKILIENYNHNYNWNLIKAVIESWNPASRLIEII